MENEIKKIKELATLGKKYYREYNDGFFVSGSNIYKNMQIELGEPLVNNILEFVDVCENSIEDLKKDDSYRVILNHVDFKLFKQLKKSFEDGSKLSNFAKNGFGVTIEEIRNDILFEHESDLIEDEQNALEDINSDAAEEFENRISQISDSIYLKAQKAGDRLLALSELLDSIYKKLETYKITKGNIKDGRNF